MSQATLSRWIRIARLRVRRRKAKPGRFGLGKGIVIDVTPFRDNKFIYFMYKMYHINCLLYMQLTNSLIKYQTESENGIPHIDLSETH